MKELANRKKAYEPLALINVGTDTTEHSLGKNSFVRDKIENKMQTQFPVFNLTGNQ